MGAQVRGGGSGSAVVAWVVVVVGVVVLGKSAEAAISCGTVDGDLSQCVAYVTSKGGTPSAACCQGVRSLYSATSASRPDRITACNCIKSLITQLASKVQPSSVSSLPGDCGVNLGYSISTSTNCATIP